MLRQQIAGIHCILCSSFIVYSGNIFLRYSIFFLSSFLLKNINEELRIATEAYLETDEALQVDEEQGIIHLSSLLKWYSSDFGKTVDDVLQWVLQNVIHPEKKAALKRIVGTKQYKVRYIPYDWGSNSHE